VRWPEGEAFARRLLAEGRPKQEFSLDMNEVVIVHARAITAKAEGEWHGVVAVEYEDGGTTAVITRCGLAARNPPMRAPYMGAEPPPGPECEECVTLPPFWP
jgi:hypothetical protein